MRYVSILLMLSGWLSVNLAAAEQPSTGFGPVAALVNDQTVGLVRLGVSRIDLASLEKQVLQPLCQSEADRIQLSIAIAKGQQWQKLLQAEGAQRIYFVITLESATNFADLRYPERIIVDHTFIVVPGVKVAAVQELIDSVQGTKKNQYGQDPRTWVECHEIGGNPVVAYAGLCEKLQSLQAAPRPALEHALAAAGDEPIGIVLAPPPVFSRAAEEIFANPLPGSNQPLGRILGHGIQWIATGLNPSAEHFRAQVVIQSADAAAAQSLANLLHQVAAQFGRFLFESNQDFPPDADAVLQSLIPKADNDQLRLSLDDAQAASLRQFAQKAYSAAMAGTYRRQSMNNLKELGLAMLNYEDKKHQLPDRAIRDKNGKPLLSWRVAILPEIDEKALYNEFHLDEPWDSEHNRKLIERMPEAFRDPDTWRRHPGRTRYLVPVGEDLAFPPDHGIPLKEITDGTSHTILIVEADPDHAVIWTKPDDLEVDLDNPARSLATGSHLFNAGFADGHVQSFLGSIKPKTLRAMFTRNGGEAIDWNDQ